MRIEGGMPVGADGRTHTVFSQNPSTLRFASSNPNMQNLPRGGEYGSLVKQCFVAPDGHLFWARDFSAIEAVLVGYFAGSPRYTRFAKLGVHAYLTSHLAGRPVDLSDGDDHLRASFAALKQEEATLYNTAKRVVHLSNYMGTPARMHQEYPETFPTIASAAKLQGFYFELFPEIPAWHKSACQLVDGTKRRRAGDDASEPADAWTFGTCYAQNPFGYIHRFYNVLNWEKIGTEWVSSFGDDAKRLIAFLPQSTAAGIIKRAARTLWEDYPWVGETLRLLIHDEIFGEAQEEHTDTCLQLSREVMEAPVPELPLDPSWEMGSHLSIGTEAKVGRVWSEMKTVRE